MRSKSERKRRKKQNNQGTFAAFHNKFQRIVSFPDEDPHRRWSAHERRCTRFLIIMKMPLIGALSSVVRQKLEDYERAKWDGFSRCSPSVSEHAAEERRRASSTRPPVHRAWQSWGRNCPPSLPTLTRAEDLNSLVSLSNSRVSLAGKWKVTFKKWGWSRPDDLLFPTRTKTVGRSIEQELE